MLTGLGQSEHIGEPVVKELGIGTCSREGAWKHRGMPAAICTTVWFGVSTMWLYNGESSAAVDSQTVPATKLKIWDKKIV